MEVVLKVLKNRKLMIALFALLAAVADMTRPTWDDEGVSVLQGAFFSVMDTFVPEVNLEAETFDALESVE